MYYSYFYYLLTYRYIHGTLFEILLELIELKIVFKIRWIFFLIFELSNPVFPLANYFIRKKSLARK